MPRYSSASGASQRGKNALIKASGAETANTTHQFVTSGDEAANAVITVDVTAATGTTPTMTVVVEGSTDGSTWFELGTIGANYRVGSVGAVTNLTAAATVRGCFPAPEFIRTRSVIAGTTPSFTYSVLAELG